MMEKESARWQQLQPLESYRIDEIKQNTPEYSKDRAEVLTRGEWFLWNIKDLDPIVGQVYHIENEQGARQIFKVTAVMRDPTNYGYQQFVQVDWDWYLR